MKCSRLKPQNHWKNVGKAAKSMGLDIEKVLTKNEGINNFIKEGFYKKTKNQTTKRDITE